MPYLIDTDWAIDYLLGQDDAVDLLQRLRGDRIGISVITYMEVVEGIRGGREARTALLGFGAFLRGTRVFAIGRPIAERAALVRVNIRAAGRGVDHRALDLLIAATAIEHDLILVTRNIRHYDDIPELRLLPSR